MDTIYMLILVSMDL